MTICVFAFVMIVGVSVMVLAAAANEQVTRQFGRQRAEYAAQSVLDTICAQIADGTVNPLAAPDQKMEGDGEDAILGQYSIAIEPYEAEGYESTFKVSVNAEKNGYNSGVYSLIKYEAGGGPVVNLPALFDVTAGAANKNTSLADTPSVLGYSNVIGSVFFDNGDDPTKAGTGGGVTENVDVIGPLELNAGVFGTKTDDPDARTHVHATGDIVITTAKVYSNVRSEANVTIGPDAATLVEGDIYANGDVTVTGGAVVMGDIHAGGNVMITGRAKVTGTIYANGTRTDPANNVFSNGNVTISDGAQIIGDIHTNGAFAAEGENTKIDGDVYANGEATVKAAATLTKLLKSNQNVTAEDKATLTDVESRKDVIFNDEATVNGTVTANGMATLKKATMRDTVSVVGKINVAGTIFRAKVAGGRVSVISETEIDITDLSARDNQNQINPDFHAPVIKVDGASLAYCNFYAAGKNGTAGTITISNSNGIMSEFYANGDIVFNDCNIKNDWDGMRGIRAIAKGTLTLDNSRMTDPYTYEPVYLAAGTALNINNSYVRGTLESNGDIVLNSAGEPKTQLMYSSIATAKRFVMNGNAYTEGYTRLQCAAMELHGTSAVGGHVLTLSIFGTDAGMQGFTSDTTGSAELGTINVNGTVNIMNGNFSVRELTAKQGGSFQNTTVRGPVTLGAAPSITGSSVSYTVVDPATLPTAPSFDGVSINALSPKTVKPVEAIVPGYDEMPLVDLQLQKKYETLPTVSIPAFALSQIEENGVTVHFDPGKDDPAILDGDEYTIKTNCTLQLGDGWKSWGKKIVLDATDADLYIRLKPQEKTDAFTLPNGVSLLAKGEHNVYVFLDEGTGTLDHTNFEMNTNCYVGRYELYDQAVPAPDTLTPNLFIFSNAKGVRVHDMGQYNSIYAFIYAPYGEVKLSGAAMLPYGMKLCGSAVASRIQMGGSNQNYVQYVPNGSIGGGGVSGWTRIGTYYIPDEG